MVPGESFACQETHEVVPALRIPSGLLHNCAGGMSFHGIIVYLVCLHVGTECKLTMFGIVQLLTGHDGPRTQSVGNTIRGREGVEPKYHGLDKFNTEHTGHPREGKCVECRPDPILDCLVVAFNLMDMFVPCSLP